MFNCADGAQRFCNEHKMRLSKIEHIFLSNLSPEHTGGPSYICLLSPMPMSLRFLCVGGLPGMILSLKDAGNVGVKLYGPPGLRKYLASTRFFMGTFDVRFFIKRK